MMEVKQEGGKFDRELLPMIAISTVLGLTASHVLGVVDLPFLPSRFRQKTPQPTKGHVLNVGTMLTAQDAQSRDSLLLKEITLQTEDGKQYEVLLAITGSESPDLLRGKLVQFEEIGFLANKYIFSEITHNQ